MSNFEKSNLLKRIVTLKMIQIENIIINLFT